MSASGPSGPLVSESQHVGSKYKILLKQSLLMPMALDFVFFFIFKNDGLFWKSVESWEFVYNIT